MRAWLFVGAIAVVGVQGCGSSKSDGASAGAGAGGTTGGASAGAGGAAGRGASGASGGSGKAGDGSGAGASAGRTGTGGATAGSGTTAGEAGSSSSGTGGGETAAPGCEFPAWHPEDFDTVLEVGPGFDYSTPSAVPWESLEPGTLVQIHYRAEPYLDKWVVSSTGTADKPIVVHGVPENGVLPVISGAAALTRSTLDYWNEDRGIVKVGGSDAPGGPASYVTIECLDITNARPGIMFSAADGTPTEYAQNAACLYLEDGSFITLRNNAVHGCGNGIFASSGSHDVYLTGNHVYDNGNVGSAYEHNSYTEALGITFELNHYGPLCDGCDGNNLKDRSAGTIIRYNWIESGNRQLDLVESDYDGFVSDPRYHQTFVYGNVLVEPDGAGNSQIVHYGGDGDDESRYRKGALFFYANTVVSTRGGNTTLFRCSTEEESVDARNNVFSVSAAGDTLAISAGMGAITLANNWLPSDWVASHDDLTGSIDAQTNVTGASPGFTDAASQDFSLAPGSACIDAAGPLASDAVTAQPVNFEYVRHQDGKQRDSDGAPDIGAFEAE